MKDTSALERCGCHPPCNDVTYDVTHSLAKWPATGFEGDSAYFDMFHISKFVDRYKDEKLTHMIEYFDNTSRRDVMADFARLNVYVAEGSVVRTEESPDYDVVSAVSDVGGQLGLWVGFSVLTLAEVLEMVGLVMAMLGGKKGHRKGHK